MKRVARVQPRCGSRCLLCQLSRVCSCGEQGNRAGLRTADTRAHRAVTRSRPIVFLFGIV
eukprot:5664344-Prymnesium_polylepis.1